MKLTLQFALLLITEGANLTEQVGYLLFGLSFHYRSEGRLSAISCQVILYRLLMGSLQEKGLGVKDRLPLANGAFLSSHAEFGLCGTAALLAAASLSETGFVPKLTTFTDLESGVKGFGIRNREAGFSPLSCRP